MSLLSVGRITGNVPTSGNVSFFSFPFVKMEAPPPQGILFTGDATVTIGTGGTGLQLVLQRFSVDKNASTTLETITVAAAAGSTPSIGWNFQDLNLQDTRNIQGVQYVLLLSQTGAPSAVGPIIDCSGAVVS